MELSSYQIQQLLTALHDRPMPARLLRQFLGGISPATLSRLTRKAADKIVVLGQTRATTYARPRNVRGHGHRFPVYMVDATSAGDVRARGDLACLYGAYWWEGDDEWPSQLSAHLPWFISDMRPEGFVGRAFAHRFCTELGVPERLSAWQDDDLLLALVRRGNDTVGNLIVGDEALERHLRAVRDGAVPVGSAKYPRLADEALAGDPAGSSAGGEQPKFTVLTDRDGELRHLLVKFSPLVATAQGQRWSDLLVCEHIALNIVAERLEMAAVGTEIVQIGGRTYLEVERFDRVGRYGRAPMHSLTIVDAEFLGVGSSNWTVAGRALADRKLLSATDAKGFEVLDAFGNLIANSDRHFGNISLIPIEQGRSRFTLAPAYDMLPMHYRPKEGEEPRTDDYSPLLTAACSDVIVSAAQEFWSTAAHDSRISAQFRALCHRNAEAVVRLEERPRVFRKRGSHE